jgi:hypothetical protein
MTNLAFAVAMALPAFAERALQVFQSLSAHGHRYFPLEDEIFLAMIVLPAASPRPRCYTGLTGIPTRHRTSTATRRWPW